MKRYVIKFTDSTYAGPKTTKDNSNRVRDLQNARVFGNMAAAFNSKGWPEPRDRTKSERAKLVEVALIPADLHNAE